MCFSHANDTIYLLLLEDLFIEKLFTENAIHSSMIRTTS